MKCDICKRKFNYSFYLPDQYWEKVVGKLNFNKNVGRVCAHCTLEKLGGLDWFILWNEPLNKSMSDLRKNQHE